MSRFIVEVPDDRLGNVPWSNLKAMLHMALSCHGVEGVTVTDYPPAHAEIIAEYRHEYAAAVADAGNEIWHSIQNGPGACPDWSYASFD